MPFLADPPGPVAPHSAVEPVTPRPEGPAGAVARGLDVLAGSPVALVAVCLGLNAILLPYCGLTHDAMLYAGQTLNRVNPGALGQDLFFRYGSQDRFSVFSLLAAPVVRTVGLRAGFAALYAVSNGLLLVAARRLIFRLVPDPRAAVVGVLFVAVTPLPFGGHGVFHANEWFTTPRVLANALTLFALSATFDRRWVRAGGLAVAAMSVHPLMAFPGLLLAAGYTVWDRLGGRVLAGLIAAGVVGFVVAVAVPDVGRAVFGTMGGEWMQEVRLAARYNFPDEWSAGDWVLLAFAVGTAGAVAATAPDRGVRRFAVLLAAAAVGGVAVAEAAAHLPYALLLQGQAYRAAWPLQMLQTPLAVGLAARAWAGGPRGKLIAALIGVYLAAYPVFPPAAVWFVLVGAVFAAVAVRGLGREPHRPDWAGRAVIWAAAIAFVLVAAARCVATAASWGALTSDQPLPMKFSLAVMSPAPVAGFLAAAAMAGLAARQGARSAALAGLAAWTIALPGLVALDRSPVGRSAGPDAADAAFFRAAVPAGDRRPTVYWPGKPVSFLWADLGANGYFSRPQVFGNMFAAGTAAEGRRRADLTGPFEIKAPGTRTYAGSRAFTPDRDRRYTEEWLRTAWDGPDPTVDDLVRLCRDPELDYVVLRYEYPGLYAATDGAWYVYDAATVRAAGGKSSR